MPEGHLTQVRDSRDRQIFPPYAETDLLIDWESVGVDLEVGTIRSPSGPYRVRAQRVSILGREYAVSVASSLQILADTRARVVTSLLVAIPFAVLLCAVSGLYIARRALAPVEEVTQAASEITVGSLQRRIAVPDTGDALERLTRTFNDMLERLEASVTRIEQFSTDASHELRTPITVIRTTAELALRHGRSEEEYQSDLKEIEQEARRLGELIDVLLTLARTGTTDDVPMNDIDLGALAADVCRSFEKSRRKRSAECSIVFFRVDSARSRAAGRLGVGLSIAKRIAELHDAEVDVTSRLGEGTEFAVRFRDDARLSESKRSTAGES